MTLYNRDTLLKDLQEQVIKVIFTKVNGEERAMRCTLMPKHLPVNTDREHLIQEHHKPENTSTVVVWDMENFGWRSFRIDSVKYVESMHESF
jgi:hypothetical protein